MATSATTIGISDDAARPRRARMLRRVFLVGLAALVAAGLGGVLGVRTSEAGAEANGYVLRVRYPAVARPGLAAPWSVTVTRRGGLAEPVTLATTAGYLEMFDENGLDPTPLRATASDGEILWEFAPPPGDTLTVSLDARIEPGVQWGRAGRTALLVGGRPLVSVTYRTWVMP